MDLRESAPPAAGEWSDAALESFLRDAVAKTTEDRKQNQILWYRPVSAKSQRFHESTARIMAAGGGNRSSKTTSMLVHMVMCSTGVFPYSLRHLIPVHYRGPISCRLVVESLTTTLEPVILPKLQWWKWSGVDRPGGERGHWGWIPKNCLVDGAWERSYSTKNRTLRLLCRDPENLDRVVGESSWQFMSVDQDASDFASGEFHIVGHDEPPKWAQWQEDEARVMSVGGRLLLAMTWPDDPAINVDWLYNEVYEPAKSGLDPSIEWLELRTTDNQQIDQDAVAVQAAKWSPEVSSVRIGGQPIRFSNRIHPEFTRDTRTWCFRCEKSVVPVPLEHKDGHGCPACGAENLAQFSHVEAFEIQTNWPSVFVIDPHPRKPHMFLWVQVSPSDDWYVVAEGKREGDCADVRREVDRIERALGLWRAQALMDPNMGASPSGQRREVTWRDEFAAAGLACDLADDSSVGRARVNTMLKVDERTHRPRLVFHERCRDTAYQMLRFSWSDYSKSVDRDQKQLPSDKYSDYPAMLRYLANSEPNFRFLRDGPPVLRRTAKRKGAY